ncbi:chitin binding [Pyrenophora seminiperda CCB06]|uniref:Chitin binding n=1 Tax=Pyrenophora seminiperda CCB06 TaxID=1302712 RepID=A0A3M7LY53_9PLEO|nr:chitin binding [Pyrenophora seminiperda CCB06]
MGQGNNDIGKLRNRPIMDGRAARVVPPENLLHARQGGAAGRCGPGFENASCDEGYCCSPSQWCGKGGDFCMAPDCLFNFGPGCDANQLPSGGSTAQIARPKLGNQFYGGEGIYACTAPNKIAITYDDGPFIYTSGVLDQFAKYGAKATFFVTGINLKKGAIDDKSTAWPSIIRRMDAEGHQVASHTWSHQDLSAITKKQRYDQMVKNEMAISNILGKFPTYMRPPYSSCTPGSGCQQDMADLGYVVSYFNLDTDDYNNVTPEKIQNAKDRVNGIIQPSNSQTDSFHAIAHDIHQQTAQNLTGYMLEIMTKKGYKMVTLGECMGEPKANWYRPAANRVATSSAFIAPRSEPTPVGYGYDESTPSEAMVTPTATTIDGSYGHENSTAYLS